MHIVMVIIMIIIQICHYYVESFSSTISKSGFSVTTTVDCCLVTFVSLLIFSDNDDSLASSAEGLFAGILKFAIECH